MMEHRMSLELAVLLPIEVFFPTLDLPANPRRDSSPCVNSPNFAVFPEFFRLEKTSLDRGKKTRASHLPSEGTQMETRCSVGSPGRHPELRPRPHHQTPEGKTDVRLVGPQAGLIARPARRDTSAQCPTWGGRSRYASRRVPTLVPRSNLTMTEWEARSTFHCQPCRCTRYAGRNALRRALCGETGLLSSCNDTVRTRIRPNRSREPPRHQQQSQSCGCSPCQLSAVA